VIAKKEKNELNFLRIQYMPVDRLVSLLVVSALISRFSTLFGNEIPGHGDNNNSKLFLILLQLNRVFRFGCHSASCQQDAIHLNSLATFDNAVGSLPHPHSHSLTGRDVKRL